MDPRLRTLLYALAVGGLAVWVGFNLAEEEYALAALCTGISVWALLAWVRGPRAEAWLFGFLILGYTIGNRGFAQLSPFSGMPLFVGEISLGFGLTLLILRGTLTRSLPFERDWLNRLLLFWLVLGCGRIWWDVRTFGFIALRDFAMVYYVLFFFCAQAVCREPRSRRVLLAALTLTYAVLPVVSVLVEFAPDFFLRQFTLRGIPLVLQKGDLLTLGLFAGFIWLVPKSGRATKADAWRWVLALASLCVGLLQLSRASMVGLAVALGCLGLAGLWRPTLTVLATGAGGLLLAGLLSVTQGQALAQTKVYSVYESVVSITDWNSTRDYRNADASNKGDNNRFRMVWWRNVITETAAVNPILGLGFGADLARNFLQEYYATEDLDFTARSPHNIFITTFGRMGALGVAVLLGIYGCQWQSTRLVARRFRHREFADEKVITLHAMCWLIMVGSCFGVVLEGPMGAIPFWIMLGLAHKEATREEIAPLPEEPADLVVAASPFPP